MNIIIYIIRFILVGIFINAGISKLFLPFDRVYFRETSVNCDPSFFDFYFLLHDSGYLYFVGFFQLICGVLMVFKRTYLLGSIMLVPLILCLLMTHVFISHNTSYIIFDTSIFIINSLLIIRKYSRLQQAIIPSQSVWI